MSKSPNIGRRPAVPQTTTAAGEAASAVEFGAPNDEAAVKEAFRSGQGLHWRDEVAPGIKRAVVDLDGGRQVNLRVRTAEAYEGMYVPSYPAEVMTKDDKRAPGIPEILVEIGPSKGDGPAVSVPGEPKWW